jgi:hypothetical protein
MPLLPGRVCLISLYLLKFKFHKNDLVSQKHNLQLVYMGQRVKLQRKYNMASNEKSHKQK